MASLPDQYKVKRTYQYEAQSDEVITVADSAIGFTSGDITPTTGEPIRRAVCTLETAQIRFRTSGSDPSTTVGHLLEVGQTLIIEGYDSILAFRAIRTGAVSGALTVTYET